MATTASFATSMRNRNWQPESLTSDVSVRSVKKRKEQSNPQTSIANANEMCIRDSHIPVNFRFLHRQVRRVRFHREFGEFPRPSIELVFPVEGHGPKDSIIQLGGAFFRSRNRFQICLLYTSAREILYLLG